ncbi:TonB-dependent receptor [Flagellimonas onchidii]|uniref:TonB-dependent receptor n=1 Tax=Flagellimonas onchidii TaxID=2562684 RepID=UPI0010A68A0A|nr:TonB-dependent receptor [Allomuricauda onchidii]
MKKPTVLGGLIFPLKFDLKMKLTTILILAVFFQINASTYSQSTRISLDLEQVALEDALDEIESLTEFKFFIDTQKINVERRVTFKGKNAKIDRVLRKIFQGTDIVYEIFNKQIILRREVSKVSTSVMGVQLVDENNAPQFTVTGTIVDEQGVPLAGANVVEKGTVNGTQADFDGNFTLNVADGNAILVFSYLGFATQEVGVNNRTSLTINMQEDAAGLDEVVVVGFGTQKKRSVVGSVSSVTASDLKIPSSNLTTALAGRVAGVISFQRSGEPGADNAQFFVRGATTFALGASPLILIDGVEFSADDLARLHPDDIASFSILKDATTTAVYGARGANGIIYVTTKIGVVGKPKFSLRYENSLNFNTQLPKFADPITYMRLANEASRTRNPLAEVPFSEERITNVQSGLNTNVFPQTNWQEKLIRDFGLSKRFNFNVRGGGEVAQYYVTAAYTNDKGVLVDDPSGAADNNVNLDRFVVRSNVSVNLTKTTKATIRLQSSLDRSTGPSVPGGGSPGANVFARTLLASPVRFPAVYDTDEANVNNPATLFGNQRVTNVPGAAGDAFYINPFAELVSGFRRASTAATLLQIELNQDLSGITEGLSMRFLGNSNRNSSFFNTRQSIPFWFFASEDNYDRVNDTYFLTRLNPNEGSRVLEFNEGTRNVSNVLYGEFALNYARTFNDKHELSGTIVGIGRELIDGNANTLQLSLPSRNIGVSGRITYGLNNKYFAEFGFGYNGSERFSEGRRFGFFPSAGAGWTISEEPFFKKLSNTINFLKLRGSYGVVGNDAIGDRNDRFFYLSEIFSENDLRDGEDLPAYIFGRDLDNAVTGFGIRRYENRNILWEVGKKLNLGFDASLFNNALNIQADYFTETREDILINRRPPLSLGLQAVTRANLGVAKTKGFDGSIDANFNINNDWWLTARVNFTYSNGRITQFEEDNFADRNAPFRSIIGSKINQQFGFIAERLFIDDEDVRNSPAQIFNNVNAIAGDIKYKDINQDGEINTLDLVPIGKPTVPQITYGFGFSMGYKKFDLSAFFQGIGETSLFLDARALAPFGNVTFDDNPFIGETPILKAFADSHWSEDNRDLFATYPRLDNGVTPNNAPLDQNDNLIQSTWWLRDGAFMRLKQLELGYTLDTEKHKNFFGMESFRIYLAGTNLLKWSKFKLWDPEVGGNGFGYPLQKVFNLGILANF